jgi:hypothetical protein
VLSCGRASGISSPWGLRLFESALRHKIEQVSVLEFE